MAFQGNTYQPRGLSQQYNSQLGAISNLVNANNSMANNIADNDAATGRTLANTFLQEQMQRQTAREQAPTKMLGALDDLEQAAMQAEQNLDLPRANQIRQAKQMILDRALGFGNTETGAKAMNLPSTTNIPQGQEFGNPAINPDESYRGGAAPTRPTMMGSESIVPSAQQPGTTQLFGGSSGQVPSGQGYSLPVRAKLAELQGKTEEGAKASINLGTLESFGQAMNLPDGAELKGLGGVKFEDLKLNPEVKSALAQGQQAFLGDIKELNKLREANKYQANIMADFLALSDDIEPVMKTGAGKLFVRQMVGKEGASGSMALAMLKELPVGLSAKDKAALTKAAAANKQMKGRLTQIAKGVFKDSANIAVEEANRAEGFLPGLGLDAGEFYANREKIVQTMLKPIADAAIATGDAGTYTQINRLYKKYTGSPIGVGVNGQLTGAKFGNPIIPEGTQKAQPQVKTYSNGKVTKTEPAVPASNNWFEELTNLKNQGVF